MNQSCQQLFGRLCGFFLYLACPAVLMRIFSATQPRTHRTYLLHYLVLMTCLSGLQFVASWPAVCSDLSLLSISKFLLPCVPVRYSSDSDLQIAYAISIWKIVLFMPCIAFVFSRACQRKYGTFIGSNIWQHENKCWITIHSFLVDAVNI